MRLSFIETSRFSATRDDHFGGDDGFRAFQKHLLEDPQTGDVIPGCGGIRKVRWKDARRGKGMRGGLRVVYLYIPEIESVVLFAVYDKDEAVDLTSEQKKTLARTVDEVRRELIAAATERFRKPTQ